MTDQLEYATGGTDLEPVTSTMFGTDNPTEIIKRATEIADALADVIRDRKLYAVISNKHHVTIEGWQTLGAMLGVTPVCEWTRPVEKGWEARVEVRTLDGRTIGAAESECLVTEKRWAKADDYAVRSMAQTRAASKALASVLRFIVILRGYEGTPAEESQAIDAEVVNSEFEPQIAEVKALYASLTEAQKRKKPSLGKAKFDAQLRAASESEEKLSRLRAALEGRRK